MIFLHNVKKQIYIQLFIKKKITMKTNKLNKKLELNKETIAKLNENEKQSIYGGAYDTAIDGCLSRVYCPSPQTNTCPIEKPNMTFLSCQLICATRIMC